MNVHLELPVLVECVPYRAKLTAASCADRWRKAQGIKMDGRGIPRGVLAVRNGARRSALFKCIGCSVGKERAAEWLSPR